MGAKARIAVVGNPHWRWNAEADWVDAFRSEGHQVEMVDEVGSRKDILNSVSNADIVLWISSRGNHTKEFVKDISSKRTTVGWHADLFWGLNRPKWKDSCMWACDYVFTADGGHDNEWRKMGVNHSWLLPAVRKAWTERKGIVKQKYVCDVAFVGNNGSSYHSEWPYRGELMKALNEMCARNRWKFLNPGGASPKVERNGLMNDFYKSARVTVGDSLCLDREKSLYWSDRVYEACGRQGFLIMPHIDALVDQSENRIPTYPWGDWVALERQIKTFLGDLISRRQTAKECRAWVAENHTYNNRVRTLLETVA